MTSTTTVEPSKPNIGVYTNPSHDLWVAEAQPTLEQVKSGEALKEGEVTIAVKSTGICGFVPSSLLSATFSSQRCQSQLLTRNSTAPMSTSGMPVALAP